MSADASEKKTLHGTVKAPNFAPKGEIDGMLIEADGGLALVNAPPHMADQILSLVGKKVEVEVGPEPKVKDHPKGDHPAFKLVALAGEPIKPPAPGAPDHKPPHHDHPEETSVSGKVQRLNYAKHGEANGVVLDSGDFVHLKPDGMKKVGLKVGQEVSASGKGGPSPSGGKAIDAHVVNGVELGPKKPH